MITDVIVLASLALTGAFVVGWLLSPALRVWVERPKHQFQDALREFEGSCSEGVARGRTR